MFDIQSVNFVTRQRWSSKQFFKATFVAWFFYKAMAK